jgi:hypothetical protein
MIVVNSAGVAKITPDSQVPRGLGDLFKGTFGNL